ncbi:MAG: NAD-dependent epimerase/dehydratase family protein [Ardenticatenia bacterium]|nr:NAD-dependent epimerase/dehydratase family protein [Ardenticatenia bacterium]
MSNLPISPLGGPHLVVGAGEVGSAVALLLAEAGRPVVVVTRSGSGPDHELIRKVAADASSVDALLAAEPHAVVIYNCVNPPYDKWVEMWPPMAQAFIDCAERTGAVLATVSNLYGYGPVDVPMTENLPLAATGTKAQVRVRMWQDAKAANDAGRIRATEVRGSDYICAGSASQFGDRGMPRILKGKSAQLLGDIDQPHTWTAPVDVARTLITVASDPRGWGRAWHVPSNAPKSARQVVDDLASAAGVGPIKSSAVPGFLMSVMGVFQPVIRELKETDYQRERPYILDDSAARTTFGLQQTPWAEIVDGLVAAYRPTALPAGRSAA